MKTIKELLDKLSDEDRRRIMYAFEKDLEQYVQIGDGRFVGVNCRSPHLIIEQTAGSFSAGTLKGELRESNSVRS